MTTRQLVRTALFAALTAVGAFLKIPLGPSAITLQFFFTAMAVKKNCRVMAEGPKGIFRNAPTAVRAANRAVRTSCRVVMAVLPVFK